MDYSLINQTIFEIPLGEFFYDLITPNLFVEFFACGGHGIHLLRNQIVYWSLFSALNHSVFLDMSFIVGFFFVFVHFFNIC